MEKIFLALALFFASPSLKAERVYLKAKDSRFLPITIEASSQNAQAGYFKDPLNPLLEPEEESEAESSLPADAQLAENREDLHAESIVHIGAAVIFGRARQASLSYLSKKPELERVEQPFLKDFENGFLHKEPFSL